MSVESSKYRHIPVVGRAYIPMKLQEMTGRNKINRYTVAYTVVNKLDDSTSEYSGEVSHVSLAEVRRWIHYSVARKGLTINRKIYYPYRAKDITVKLIGK